MVQAVEVCKYTRTTTIPCCSWNKPTDKFQHTYPQCTWRWSDSSNYVVDRKIPNLNVMLMLVKHFEYTKKSVLTCMCLVRHSSKSFCEKVINAYLRVLTYYFHTILQWLVFVLSIFPCLYFLCPCNETGCIILFCFLVSTLLDLLVRKYLLHKCHTLNVSYHCIKDASFAAAGNASTTACHILYSFVVSTTLQKATRIMWSTRLRLATWLNSLMLILPFTSAEHSCTCAASGRCNRSRKLSLPTGVPCFCVLLIWCCCFVNWCGVVLGVSTSVTSIISSKSSSSCFISNSKASSAYNKKLVKTSTITNIPNFYDLLEVVNTVPSTGGKSSPKQYQIHLLSERAHLSSVSLLWWDSECWLLPKPSFDYWWSTFCRTTQNACGA